MSADGAASSGSHRAILKASSIIGGASVINVAVGLARMKVAALLLGPAGIGLIGLLQNLMTTGASLAALGSGTAGTRQVVRARQEGEQALAQARRAFLGGALLLAVLGAILFWLFRAELAELVLGDRALADEAGWVAIGVAMTVIAGAQTAFLTGLRRLRDVALVMILSALLGTLVAVGALYALGSAGIPLFVVAAPAAMALVGWLFVLRVPRPASAPVRWSVVAAEWRAMVMLGGAFTIASLATTLGQLAVRMLVQRELGVEALGLFQASWVISMTYIAFVLQAMGTDYYPRLTAVIAEPVQANRVVNDQIEVALFLAGPVLLAMLSTAPWVMQLLYSSDFVEAAAILRWQIIGDLLKVASWPAAYVMLAAGDGRRFMFAESSAILVFIALTALGLPLLGVEATGLAFAGMYLFYLPLTFFLARQKIGFAWDSRVYRLLGSLVAAAMMTLVAGRYHELLGAAAGLLSVAGFILTAIYGLRSALPAPAAAVLTALRGKLWRSRRP